jgi:hypothetical protein
VIRLSKQAFVVPVSPCKSMTETFSGAIFSANSIAFTIDAHSTTIYLKSNFSGNGDATILLAHIFNW